MTAKRTTTKSRRKVQTGTAQASLARESRHTIELAHELGYAYREYAHYTLLDRAIADVRDGFKPVHRRIAYAMGEMNLRSTAPHRKSARVVGEVLGKYHPHGDQSVYDALARMAQDFSMGEVLIDGQGNFGSIDGDSPAAMRYTEVRMAPLGEELLRDIDMDTVDWQDNFDNSLKEPAVLPARFPNVLVNGSSGIAVGFAANLAPHNLGEVCDAASLVCKRWNERDKITVQDLMHVLPGPDFPTGGLVFRYRLDRENGADVRSDAIETAYETGSAGIVCQARMNVERQDGSRAGEQIVISEIPFGQQKSTIIQRIATEVRNGRITGVVDVVDESDRDGVRVVIQVSRQADPNEVLEMLVRRSTLRTTFGVNNLVLVPRESEEGRITVPRTLSLKKILEHFVLHRLEVIQRRSRYELERRRARLHIVQGLLIALDHIDDVIDTIRRSRTTETACTNLMRKFKLSEIQATAILDMPLRRLPAMERAKLRDEEKSLKERIQYLEGLLASEQKQLDVILEETGEIKARYARPRRTTIVDAAPGEGEAPVTVADLAVPDAPQMVILTTQGVERCNADAYTYDVQTGVSRGPVVVHRMRALAEPTDRVFVISSGGQVWVSPVGQLAARATYADIGLKAEGAVYVGVVRPQGYLVLGTRGGRVKRTEMSAIDSAPDGTWSEIMGLEDGDRVLFAGTCGEEGEVLFFTNGRVLRIKTEAISCQQTPSARGVIGIKLRDEDSVLGGAVLEETQGYMLFVISEKGFIKRVPVDEFPAKGRGSMGVLSLNQTAATGPVVAVGAGKATRSTTVDVLGQEGRRQRLSLRSVPIENRMNRGRKAVKLSGANEVIVLD
ncbi:MAG: DNA topoisomerase (ATP-hydrolyzing) subunit A [Anaerolineae bacterium]